MEKRLTAGLKILVVLGWTFIICLIAGVVLLFRKYWPKSENHG